MLQRVGMEACSMAVIHRVCLPLNSFHAHQDIGFGFTSLVSKSASNGIRYVHKC